MGGIGTVPWLSILPGLCLQLRQATGSCAEAPQEQRFCRLATGNVTEPIRRRMTRVLARHGSGFHSLVHRLGLSAGRQRSAGAQNHKDNNAKVEPAIELAAVG